MEEVVDRVSALLEVVGGGKVVLKFVRQNVRGRDRVYGGWVTRPGGLVGTSCQVARGFDRAQHGRECRLERRVGGIWLLLGLVGLQLRVQLQKGGKVRFGNVGRCGGEVSGGVHLSEYGSH